MRWNILESVSHRQKMLTTKDRKLIQWIDFKTRQLLHHNASDQLILTTLKTYVPEVNFMLQATCEKLVELYCQEYAYFNYFLQLMYQ